jgi:hypothetical protein
VKIQFSHIQFSIDTDVPPAVKKSASPKVTSPKTGALDWFKVISDLAKALLGFAALLIQPVVALFKFFFLPRN